MNNGKYLKHKNWKKKGSVHVIYAKKNNENWKLWEKKNNSYLTKKKYLA